MAERKTYTEEQKMEILKKAEETSVAAAAKEYHVSAVTISRWKASDKATAARIETKKKTRAAGRKVKEAVEAPVEKAAGDVKDTVEKAKLADQMAVGKIKAERTRKTAEKAAAKKEKAADRAARKEEKAAGRPAAKRAAVRMNLVFQSTMGGAVTPEQIALKLPKNTSDAYIKLEENKIYYVLKDGTTGFVEIWE